MNEPEVTGTPTDREGATTLTDEEIETWVLETGARGAVLSRMDDGGDTGDDSGDTGDDSGDTADTADTGDDSGDAADTGDDAGDGGDSAAG
jgi:hypothetical protein